MVKNNRSFRLVQDGMNVHVVDADGKRIGEERYLPNGWKGLSDEIRQWLIACGYTNVYSL